MLHFLNEINDLLELPIVSTLGKYEYINLSGKVLYVQGYKDILTFNETAIVLKLKQGELKIQGQNLNIKDLNINSIVIEGDIYSVEEVGTK